jgi:hypothetical protein
MPPDRGLSDKKHAGVKGNKVRLTFALTSNADGSVKKEAFIIGKAQKPRAFCGKSGKQLGFYYRNNAKAWMTGVLYGEWIKKWDDDLQKGGAKDSSIAGQLYRSHRSRWFDKHSRREFLRKFDTSCTANGRRHYPMLQGSLSCIVHPMHIGKLHCIV